ncbi:17837_t:CDS:2 [Racocetra persica]|uniref:17837_t:CDS:1 n=1 Tax=Racocetra persica TaxID=160502 RepID=A0ACA9KCZ5_9GLOM|nr:17837_t:CDS:2 [Racocetra persica]
MLNQTRKQILINRIDNLEGIIAGNLAQANRCRERGETERADAYLENNEQVKKIIAECRNELTQIEQQLQEYLQEKYPTEEAKSEVQELILTSITEILTGGELDLTAFSNLEKVEIDPNILSTPLTKIITQGLTKLKEIIWEQVEEETEEDKKLWEELGIGGDIIKKKVDKTPLFWNKFLEELNWVKDNLPAPYQLDLTLLLNPSTFPYPELESSLLSIYFPTNQEIADGQMIKTTNDKYIIQVHYHSQSPFSKEISELVITTPLKLEIANLKQKQEQLPTSENFEELAQQKQK